MALLLALLFALQVTSVRGKTLTYDAPVHLRYGQQVIHGDATRFDDSKMPVSAWNALPGRIAEELEPHSWQGPVRRALAGDTAARVPTMLASLVLALLVFHWARSLYGLAAGFLALLLHAFDPNLLAHSRLVTTDLYAALGIILALYTFWRFLGASAGRARIGWGVAAAFAFAFAQVAKYSSAYLVPVMLLILALRFGGPIARELRRVDLRALGRRLGPGLGSGALWSAVFAAVFVLVVHAAFLFEGSMIELSDYRFRSEPFQNVQQDLAGWEGLRVPLPYPYVEGLDWVLSRERTGDGYGNIYLLGETRNGEGFAGYYFVVGLFKIPLPTQLLWLAALGAYLARRRRFDFLRDELFLLAPAAFFVVYLNFLFRAQMGMRYMLVVLPFLHVFAGSLLADRGRGWLRELIERHGWRAAVAPAVLAAWLTTSVLSFHPHYIPYVNELLPDRKMAYRIYADSNLDWGQDLEAVEEYLAEHPEVTKAPPEPAAGRFLVSPNWLVGVFRKSNGEWLAESFEPVGHFRYSHLFFEVSEEEAEAVRRRAAPPPPPPAGRPPA